MIIKENENIKEMKSLTAQNLVNENSQLINECLNLADYMYNALTTDTCLKEEKQSAPDCMIKELSIQNEKLKLLNEVLVKMRTNLLEGGN